MNRYKIVETFKEVKQIAEWCKKTRYCSFDFETTGLEFYDEENHHPTCLGICFQPGFTYVIPLCHPESPFKYYYKVLHYLGKHVFENKDIVKIAWNMKFEYKWLLRYGVNLLGYCIDGMLAKYCLVEERPNDLKDMVDKFYPEWGGYENEVRKLAAKYGWGNIPMDLLAKYNAIDCDATLRLAIRFELNCIKKGFHRLLRNMLMPLTRVLSFAEFEGLIIDSKYLENQNSLFIEDIKRLETTLLNNRQLRIYKKHKEKQFFKTLINDAQKEIESLEEELENEDDERTKNQIKRKIANREKKVEQYVAGNLVTKKELKGKEKFNFKSPDQLKDFLFISKKGLRFKIVKYTKDKNKQDTDNPSTEEEVLLELKPKDKSGFIEGLLKYREITHLYDTYVKGIRERLHTNNRIYSSFLIHGTVTGRLSSKNPNLQNVPRVTTDPRIKPMFICPENKVWLEVDYSQAELRVLAELSEDQAMIDIFNKNYNIHVATACKINGGIEQYNKVKSILSKADEMTGEELQKPENKEYLFWTKEKKKGKTLNFSVGYLQSAKETGRQMGVSTEKAAQFQKEWFNQFPGVKKWIKNQEKILRRQEYVKNLFGRKRRLPDINSGEFGFENKAIRDAVNAPIQGTASDFTQFSSIIIYMERLRGNLPMDLHYIATVHDSLDFYCGVKGIHKAVPLIDKICNNPETDKYFGFKMNHVKMKVSSEAGINWGALTGYDAWNNYEKMVK